MRVFVDTNVLFLACRSQSPSARLLLARKDLVFLSSMYLRLEVLPKPRFFGNVHECAYYDHYFLRSMPVEHGERLHALALEEAEKIGLSGMDALHLAAASVGGAEVFITDERQTRPMYRTALVSVRHLSEIDPMSDSLF